MPGVTTPVILEGARRRRISDDRRSRSSGRGPGRGRQGRGQLQARKTDPSGSRSSSTATSTTRTSVTDCDFSSATPAGRPPEECFEGGHQGRGGRSINGTTSSCRAGTTRTRSTYEDLFRSLEGLRSTCTRCRRQSSIAPLRQPPAALRGFAMRGWTRSPAEAGILVDRVRDIIAPEGEPRPAGRSRATRTGWACRRPRPMYGHVETLPSASSTPLRELRTDRLRGSSRTFSRSALALLASPGLGQVPPRGCEPYHPTTSTPSSRRGDPEDEGRAGRARVRRRRPRFSDDRGERRHRPRHSAPRVDDDHPRDQALGRPVRRDACTTTYASGTERPSFRSGAQVKAQATLLAEEREGGPGPVGDQAVAAAAPRRAVIMTPPFAARGRCCLRRRAGRTARGCLRNRTRLPSGRTSASA